MHFAAVPENNRSPRPGHDVRGPDLGPALKRDRVLQRVRAARRRLTPGSETTPKLR
ncbi:MAG TPA: hypothetical protein VFY75_03305 [Solirubrobacterales bacterium]|nr:hypothetical protein [Solirubrobacterales bacterium]